jgi:hypothetical protein
MLSEILVPHLKLHLFIGNKLNCVHYAWKGNKLVPVVGTKTATFQTILTLVNILYVGMQFILVSAKWKRFSLVEKFEAIFFTFVYIGFLGLRFGWEGAIQNVQLINVITNSGIFLRN